MVSEFLEKKKMLGEALTKVQAAIKEVFIFGHVMKGMLDDDAAWGLPFDGQLYYPDKSELTALLETAARLGQEVAALRAKLGNALIDVPRFTHYFQERKAITWTVVLNDGKRLNISSSSTPEITGEFLVFDDDPTIIPASSVLVATPADRLRNE